MNLPEGQTRRFEHRLLVIDLETTGFDPARHACVEIGAVLLDEKLDTIKSFTSLIAPWKGARFVPEAMAVNGITRKELRKAPAISTVVRQFQEEFCEHAPRPILAGWNVWFDASFLRTLFLRGKAEWPFRHRYLDIQSIVSFHQRVAAASQENTIAALLGETQKHRALSDAEHSARILRAMATKHLSAKIRSPKILRPSKGAAKTK